MPSAESCQTPSRRTPSRLHRSRLRARLAAALAAAVVAVAALAGCASHPATQRDRLLPLAVPDQVAITTGTLPGLGTVLTDVAGHTLYLFPPDADRQVTCTGACAGTWPPVVIAAGHGLTATGRAAAAELGTLPDPNSGARVVTYAGHPLYRYAGDTGPHTANGQGLFSDGGPWYAVDPSGAAVTAGG